jgi:ferredoxin
MRAALDSERWRPEQTHPGRAMLDAAPVGTATEKPAAFMPRGAKRGLLETAFRELHLSARAPVDVVALAPGAPFGSVTLDLERCTLCHACVTACPTGALSDNPDRAMLRFTESICVQCGLCEATCPEDAITLVPRLDFQAWNAPRRILKEEDPFECIVCGKPFGTKSTNAWSPNSRESTGCSTATMPGGSTS